MTADLDRARDDDAAFGDLIGEPLATWQAINLVAFVTCVVGARQMGKSRLIAIKALRLAVSEPGRHVLLASSSEEGSRRLIDRCRTYARGFPALAASFEDEQLGILRFRNGSIIRAIATSEIAARGWVADAAFIDEAQLLDQRFVDALLPTLSASDGRVMLCGTAGISEGPFYDFCRQGEVGSEHVRTIKWVPKVAGGPDDAPWIRASVVAAARESMTPHRFAAEFLAEFASGSDAVFPMPVLTAATVDYRTTTLADFRPEARMSLGIDWGERADRTCAVGVGRFAGQSTFGIASVKRWEAGASLPGVISAIASSPMRMQAVWAERNGIGGGLVPHLWQAMARRPVEAGGGVRPRSTAVIENEAWDVPAPPRRRSENFPTAVPIQGGTRRRQRETFYTERHAIFTTAGLKSSIFGATRLMMEGGDFVIAASEVELISELMHLRSEPTATGERISGAPHDDLAMALAMCLGPVPDRQKGGDTWRCRVAELARGPVPLAELPGAMAGLPMVRTESGAEVPRVPVWQSVLGGELTVPKDLDRARRESPVIRRAREQIAVALKDERGETR